MTFQRCDKIRGEVKVGIQIYGKGIDLVGFVDDIVVVTEIEDLHRILGMTERTMEEYDMKINKPRTKYSPAARK